LHWTMGTAGITAAVKSRIGLGIAVSTPTSGSEEGQNSPGQKGCQDAGINLDSTSANVIKTNDDASRTKTVSIIIIWSQLKALKFPDRSTNHLTPIAVRIRL
jgi:hypothetical protein